MARQSTYNPARALALSLGVVLGIVVGSGLANRANACALAGNPEHTVVENAADKTAPTITATRVTSFSRGVGPQKNGCGGGTSASSCDDIGSIKVGVVGTDDVTKPEELGWILELDTGTLPEGLTLPATPVRATGNALQLAFIDGASDDQESVDFILRVTAVDGAGNRSAATKVAVSHGGVNACGSHIAPRTDGSSTVLGIALAIAFARRAGARLSRRRATR